MLRHVHRVSLVGPKQSRSLLCCYTSRSTSTSTSITTTTTSTTNLLKQSTPPLRRFTTTTTVADAPTLSHRHYATTATATPNPQTRLFKPLDGQVDTETHEFLANQAASQELFAKYQQLLTTVRGGGGEKARVRHTEQNKKVLVEDRLKLLFDDPDDVLELGTFAGLGMKYGDVPRAGLVAAIGRIHGVHVLVCANDATVKGGTIFPIGVKKNMRCHEIAQENRLPVIYVVDSGGAFLPLQAEIFTPGGRGFYNEAILNAMNVPQLAIVVGSCTAGAAYIPTMAQEALIVHRVGTIFLGGPPLVYAALGEVVSPEKLGGATMHSSVSGCTDYFSGTEAEAFATGRDVVATFNITPGEEGAGEEPLYDASELAGIIPAPHTHHTMDMYKVIARIVDGSRFHEFKTMFGPSLVTGFAFIQGHLVGVVGNNGPMTGPAALKGAHFVQLCSQRALPILFLHNSAPATQGKEGKEEEDAGRITAHAKLMSAVACSSVPKITVIVGSSIGADNFMMCGRSFSPNFLFSWPNARTCIDDPEALVEEYMREKYPDGSGAGEKDPEYVECREKVLAEVEGQSSAFRSSGEMWDDGIILPHETRKVVGRCLEIVKQAANVPNPRMDYSVMRM